MQEIKVNFKIDTNNFKEELKKMLKEAIEEVKEEIKCDIKNDIQIKENINIDQVAKEISEIMKKNIMIEQCY